MNKPVIVSCDHQFHIFYFLFWKKAKGQADLETGFLDNSNFLLIMTYITLNPAEIYVIEIYDQSVDMIGIAECIHTNNCVWNDLNLLNCILSWVFLCYHMRWISSRYIANEVWFFMGTISVSFIRWVDHDSTTVNVSAHNLILCLVGHIDFIRSTWYRTYLPPPLLYSKPLSISHSTTLFHWHWGRCIIG